MAALEWDDEDLDLIEAGATEQHDLRTAVEPLTALDDKAFDNESESSRPSLAEVATPPAIAPEFEPSDSARVARSPTHSESSESETAPPVLNETTPPDYEPDGNRSRDGAEAQASVFDEPPSKSDAGGHNGLPTAALSHDEEPTALKQYELELEAGDLEPLIEQDMPGGFDDIDTEIDDEYDLVEALPDIWDVGSDDEEDDAPLYDVDVGGARLSEYDKAKRLAAQTARRFDDQADELWPVLLDIFQESPWPITQRSIERLLTAGVSAPALALATEIRRIWRDHPEFGQSSPPANARGESWVYTQEAMSQLSWPRAARLADSWPAYPDAAEVECFLEDLYDLWHSNSVSQRSFTSFQLYLGYATGYLDGTLQDWPEFSFTSDDALEDPFNELESRASWSTTCEALRGHGIERPMTSRPVYVYSKPIPQNKKAKKEETS
ncbi:hypothetical protein S4A8_03208 [Salinisphaera sp. S4-8]